MDPDDSKESDSSNLTIDVQQQQQQQQQEKQHPENQNSTTRQSMAKRQLTQGHHTHNHHHYIRRRYMFAISGVTLLVLIFLLRTYESAYLGFEDTQTIKLVYSKENDNKKIVVAETPERSSWLWSSKKSTVQFPADNGVETNKGTPRYSVPLHAAEALQCRDSVVNFVINATDGKDECVGLQRAFDQTCGVGAAVVDSGAAVASDRRLNRRRKKRWAQDVLSTAYFYRRWRVWLYRMSRWTYLSVGWLGNVLTTGDSDCDNPFFFAEDEIVEAWSQAEYLVENDLDQYAYIDVIKGWESQRAMVNRHLQETDNSTTAVGNRTKVTYSLDLPTAQKHASEHLVDQTLSLHQGDNLVDAPSNTTAESVTVETKDGPKNAKTQQPVAVYDPVELRRCCASILNVYHENCSTDDEETISDSRLFFVVCVMAACGTVKSLIRHFKVLWLPEAAGCILVGVVSGYIVMFFPHHDLSFDGHWFLRIMVPPIIFEAALSIDKRSFNKHIVPIVFYAVGGTLMATLLTAYIVHQASFMLRHVCTPLPYVEALTFGALISSIDPIAVLSVLSNMGMTDMDTIYVLIFGESLLNDGVAIVLFETLVRFLDDSIIIDSEEITAAAVHFSVVAVGSLLVGVGAGMVCFVILSIPSFFYRHSTISSSFAAWNRLLLDFPWVSNASCRSAHVLLLGFITLLHL